MILKLLCLKISQLMKVSRSVSLCWFVCYKTKIKQAIKLLNDQGIGVWFTKHEIPAMCQRTWKRQWLFSRDSRVSHIGGLHWWVPSSSPFTTRWVGGFTILFWESTGDCFFRKLSLGQLLWNAYVGCKHGNAAQLCSLLTVYDNNGTIFNLPTVYYNTVCNIV